MSSCVFLMVNSYVGTWLRLSVVIFFSVSTLRRGHRHLAMVECGYILSVLTLSRGHARGAAVAAVEPFRLYFIVTAIFRVDSLN